MARGTCTPRCGHRDLLGASFQYLRFLGTGARVNALINKASGAGRQFGSFDPSGLMPRQPGNSSVERLMDFLTTLGQDVEITVRPTRQEHGGVSLVPA